jgi:polysaccharide pyruvyl transferase WcaK-like protein
MTELRALALLHLVNLRSANVGNGALTLGLESILEEDLARPVRWSREPWDDYTFGLKPFDRRLVESINNSSDGLIVGGAVALNGRAHFPNTGMRFDLPRELWSELRRPIVFYALSYRHWPGQTYHHADRLRAAIADILERPNMLFGVRNDGTREWLASFIGITDERIHVVPDPAVFVPFDDSGADDEIEPGRPNIILSFNDEDPELRYGTPERRGAILKSMAVAFERVLERTDVNLVLATHYFDDARMMTDFIALSRPQLAHQRMIPTGCARLPGTRRFYGRYRKADLIVSMRVHSMSPSIGLGVPMIPLVTQDRMVDFLRDVGLDDLRVDAFAPDLAERLERAILGALADPAPYRHRFAAARAAMRARAQVFNREVARVLGGGRT